MESSFLKSIRVGCVTIKENEWSVEAWNVHMPGKTRRVMLRRCP